jgi:hypothetical protein
MTARAFGEAAKSCGYPCPGDKLKSALDQVDLALPGLVDSFRYTSSNHYPYANWYLYKAVGNQTTQVDKYPADQA